MWFAIHDNRRYFAGLGVHYFPDGIFHLIGGASERFRVAGFEGHDGCGGGGGTGAVFMGDIFVLLLEVEGHRGVA